MSQSRNRRSTLLTLDVLEKQLFTDRGRHTFLNNRKSEDLESSFNILLTTESEKRLQELLAPLLRSATIRYLREGISQYAVDTRTSYLQIYHSGGAAESLKTLLKKQAQNEAWAGLLEVGALGSLLDITVLITPISNKKEGTIFAAYESPNPDAPVIHIYNHDNVHFYFHKNNPNETKGDGNCFYNAFAQGMRECALKLENPGEQLTSSEKKLRQFHKQLDDSPRSRARHASVEINISKIPSEKLKAEQADHEVALEIARQQEEGSENLVHSSPVSSVAKNIFMPPEDNDYAKTFYDALLMMAEEATRLEVKSRENSKYRKAAKSAKLLVRNLNNAAIDHFDNNLSTKEFVTTCNKAIKIAKPDLESLRGWKQIIGNVVLAIAGIGIGYLVAGLINKAMTGDFLFFRPKTTIKLKKLKEAIEPPDKFKSRR